MIFWEFIVLCLRSSKTRTLKELSDPLACSALPLIEAQPTRDARNGKPRGQQSLKFGLRPAVQKRRDCKGCSTHVKQWRMSVIGHQKNLHVVIVLFHFRQDVRRQQNRIFAADGH